MMAVSYKRLWKLLIDRDMKKKDLAEQANLSRNSHPCEGASTIHHLLPRHNA